MVSLIKEPRSSPPTSKNPDKIDWDQLSMNPGIFVYDYTKMSRPFTEELMQNRFHPKNMDKFEQWGY